MKTPVEWTQNTRDPVGQETHAIRWDMKHTSPVGQETHASGETGNTQDPVGHEIGATGRSVAIYLLFVASDNCLRIPLSE